MASSGRLSNGAAMVAQGKLRATSSEDGKEDDDDCRSPLLEDFEMIKTIGPAVGRAHFKNLTAEDQLRYLKNFTHTGPIRLPDPLDVKNEHLFLKKMRNLPKVSWAHLHDYRFEPPCPCSTGTFGRVCLCRDPGGAFHAMKILEISDVIRLKQVEHVKNEKAILLQVQHPFIIRMRWTHHDATCLYMLFEYVSGGELFTYLRNAGRFSSATGCFYAAEIVLALEYLHSLHIVYRDLKPENLLLDREGHLKITDFGFAKKLHDRTWTLCGTPEYLAPEIIQSKGHNRAVDWWALGVLVYEMLAGYPPYFDDNPFAIYEKILAGKVEWPRHIDPVAKDLIKKLLVNDRTKRLGSMKNGAEDVKRHRWFKGLNWDDVLEKKQKPPIVPKVSHEGDTGNFDDYPERDGRRRPPSTASSSDKEVDTFEDF